MDKQEIRIRDMNTRQSTLDELGDTSAPAGSKEWAIAVKRKLQAQWQELSDAENHLKVYRDLMKEHQGWKVLVDRTGRAFRTFDSFCRHSKPEGLGIDPRELDAEVERRRKGRPKNNNDNIIIIPEGQGTSKKYLRDRLSRERPDLLSMVNEMDTSVYAAAVEAGWCKRMIQCEPTVEGFTKAIQKHLTAEQITELKERL